MSKLNTARSAFSTTVTKALGEVPEFNVGDVVRVGVRFPIGHYRVPLYIRGKKGIIDKVLAPVAVNNEVEGFGRNAGNKGYYYRVALPLTELWPTYDGAERDQVIIEVSEAWLEKLSNHGNT